MGYYTDFDGILEFTRPMTKEELYQIDAISYLRDMCVSPDGLGLIYCSEKTPDIIDSINFIITNARKLIPDFGVKGILEASTEYEPYHWVVMIGADGMAHAGSVSKETAIVFCPKVHVDTKANHAHAVTSEELLEIIRTKPSQCIDLPIPIDANRGLLLEMFGACRDSMLMSREIITGSGDVTPPSPAKLLAAEREFKLAIKRLIQIEWRLNLMGLYAEGRRCGDEFAPVERNYRVQRIVENTAKPGNFDIG